MSLGEACSNGTKWCKFKIYENADKLRYTRPNVCVNIISQSRPLHLVDSKPQRLIHINLIGPIIISEELRRHKNCDLQDFEENRKRQRGEGGRWSY